MKLTAFLTPTTLIMIKVMIVQDASAERVDPQCGKCTNCYFAGNNGCFLGWTKAQCDSVDVYKWCGDGGNDPLPPPANHLAPPHPNDVVPPPPDYLVPPPHPNDVVPRPPDHLVPPHQNGVVPPPLDHLVPPPHPNDVVPPPPDHLVPPHQN
ncbi:hypothetical protein DYB31_013707, partial [Aphanomyces astaci]